MEVAAVAAAVAAAAAAARPPSDRPPIVASLFEATDLDLARSAAYWADAAFAAPVAFSLRPFAAAFADDLKSAFESLAAVAAPQNFDKKSDLKKQNEYETESLCAALYSDYHWCWLLSAHIHIRIWHVHIYIGRHDGSLLWHCKSIQSGLHGIRCYVWFVLSN